MSRYTNLRKYADTRKHDAGSLRFVPDVPPLTVGDFIINIGTVFGAFAVGVACTLVGSAVWS